jgi:threonine/homoserine efflux transporter RhtA
VRTDQSVASTAPAPAARNNSATAVLLVVVVGVLMQAGSALAVKVIDSVGVVEALWLRTALAAVILAALRLRWLRLPKKGDRLLVLGLTISLVAMNFFFYEAISRLPVGIVVAVEFLGPLGVAIAGSRRLLDLLWVVLAATGVWLLARPSGSVGVPGLVFALLAAAGWAAFIVMAKRTVSRMEPLRATTLMLAGATVILTPVWIGTGVEPWRSCPRPCRTFSSWPPSSACGLRPTASSLASNRPSRHSWGSSYFRSAYTIERSWASSPSW